MIELIKIPEINKLNIELLNSLSNLPITELKELKKLHKKKRKLIENEIAFENYSTENKLNEITKELIEKHNLKCEQFILIINKAIEDKYLKIYNLIKV
jgi:hypothetical protein